MVLARRWPWIASAVGMAAALLVAGAWYGQPGAALQSWLFVWWFVLGIPLGSIAILCVHNLTGGAWGDRIRPTLEAATAMLPASLLLSFPLWIGLSDIYTWARPADVAASTLLQDKAWYLDARFFTFRAGLCFAAWLALGHLLRRWSSARAPGTAGGRRLRALSAIGLLVYVVTITIEAVDWIMSLTPEWHSTTFGLLAGTGQALCAFSFAIACAAWLDRDHRPVAKQDFQDLGNLLLTLVMTWAYLAFTQYLIIWAEDLPTEIGWYLPRLQTSWRWGGVFLVVFHFAIPLIVLLSRQAKRAPRALGIVAGTLLLAHLGDAFWLVAPTFRPTRLALHWSDPLAVVALGGIWILLFLRRDSAAAPPRSTLRRELTEHG
jgi:hypothetical protein